MRLILPTLAFLSGFSLMVVELSAVRALAPSFGDSSPVWTNVIGVILFALAVGAFVGGRLADRGQARRTITWSLLIAGSLILLVPFLTPRVASWILPEALPLDRALAVMVEGSLAVSMLVFAPAVLLLGTISPCLIRVGSEGHPEQVGRVCGSLYAAGTVGSLIGTFLATHWLVPELGLRGTFAIGGAALLAAGIAWGVRGARSSSLLLPLLLAIPSLFAREPLPVWAKTAQNRPEILESVDSRYQRLWVVKTQEDVAGRMREVIALKINEGLDSFHSVRIDGMELTGGRYYDSFALLPLLLQKEQALRVLSLGCGAGSILRVLRYAHPPGIRGTAIDIDPMTIELGRKYFGLGSLERDSVRFASDLDARVFVNSVDRAAAPYDLICLDAYRNQFYLPVHLASREFFVAASKRLAPKGILALNVGDLSQDGPVLTAVARTMATVFPVVESFRVGGDRNFLVLGHSSAPGILARELRGASRPSEMPDRLWEQARRDGATRHWEADPDFPILSDWDSRLPLLHEQLYERRPGEQAR